MLKTKLFIIGLITLMVFVSGCNTQQYSLHYSKNIKPNDQAKCDNCLVLVGESGCHGISQNELNRWEQEIYAYQQTNKTIDFFGNTQIIDRPITFGELCAKENNKCEIKKGECS